MAFFTSPLAFIIYGAVAVILLVLLVYYFVFHRPLRKRIATGRVQPLQVANMQHQEQTKRSNSAAAYDMQDYGQQHAYNPGLTLTDTHLGTDVSSDFTPTLPRKTNEVSFIPEGVELELRPLPTVLSDSTPDSQRSVASSHSPESSSDSPPRASQFKNWVEWSDAVEDESQHEVVAEKPTVGFADDATPPSQQTSKPGGILKSGTKLRRQDSTTRIAQYRQELRREKERQRQKCKSSSLAAHREETDPDSPGSGRKLRRRVSFKGKSGTIQSRFEDYSTTQATESVKHALTRKLSNRSSIHELFDRKILTRFSDYVEVREAPSKTEYNRATDPTWTKLSARDKRDIRTELNTFKEHEMTVHEASQHNVRLHTNGPEYRQFQDQEGARVSVQGYPGMGTLRFYGPHKVRMAVMGKQYSDGTSKLEASRHCVRRPVQSICFGICLSASLVHPTAHFFVMPCS
eukprot:m.229321 g.229321  ORF g.229321 m.229321 type:complete len:460 (+) comp18839_c0_seq5:684-2063(+)